MYSYFFMQQIFKIKLACQDGVIEVNNTISQAKFLHVVLCLVFKGTFRLFGAKCGYSLRYWELYAGINLTGYHPLPGLLHRNVCPAPRLLHNRKCPGGGAISDDIPGTGQLHQLAFKHGNC